MIRALTICLCAAAWPLNAAAANGIESAAQEAADLLTEAAHALEKAGTARDRVAALSRTVRAYEKGLAAVREGQRAAAIRERQIMLALNARKMEIGRLLAALQTIGAGNAPVALLHPSGPLGTARAAMLITDVTPALQAKVNRLRRDLEDIRAMRAVQDASAERLRQGLETVQTARANLSKAMADRTDLPRRFTADPARTAILIASTETLDAFAGALGEIALDEVPGSLPDLSDRKGTLALPVLGTILRRPGEPDAAGVMRPGMILATLPGALVTTPVAATIRYRGPLLDYGHVSILEPQSGLLFIFAGMGTVFGEPGQVLPAGSPVGLMGGNVGIDTALVSQPREGTGSDQTETLYIEVREGNAPVDPLEWFQSDKD